VHAQQSGTFDGSSIINNGFFAQTFPIEPVEKTTATTLNFRDIPSVSDEFAFAFGNAGFMKDGLVLTANTIPIKETPIPLAMLLEKDVPQQYYIGEDLTKWAYLKGAKKISRQSKSGHDYTFSEGPIAFPDPIDLPARTMLTSESSLNRSTHIILDPETDKLRKITPLEAERIQGFDDGWTGHGMPEKMRYFCMGNALVVPMVTRMGKALTEIFDAET
jgi:DNA (cytosine-5)-methyltransferase 1